MNIPSQFPGKSAMPWSPTAQVEAAGEKESWITTYMDVVTLMLTIFVLLVAYQLHANSTAQPSQATQTAQTTTRQTIPPNTATVDEATTETVETAVAAADDAVVQNEITELKDVVDDRTESSPPQAQPAAMSSITPLTVEQAGEPSAPPLDPNEANPPIEIAKLETALKTALGENIPPIEIHPNGFTVPLSEQILFARASATISDQGRELLHKLAPTFAEFEGEIFVEGHTDNVPIATAIFPSNWELSTHRATSVTRLLIEFGLPAARLRAVGFGDTQPVADNETAEGRSANRRVSLVFRLPTPPSL